MESKASFLANLRALTDRKVGNRQPAPSTTVQFAYRGEKVTLAYGSQM